jgi:hypothetical protein
MSLVLLLQADSRRPGRHGGAGGTRADWGQREGRQMALDTRSRST